MLQRAKVETMAGQLQPLAVHICTQCGMLHTSPAIPELLCIQDDNQHARVSIFAHPCIHAFYVNHTSKIVAQLRFDSQIWNAEIPLDRID